MESKLLISICGLFICICIQFNELNAQIVNIPDGNLKTALLDHQPSIDVNGDSEIQLTEAQNYNGDLILPGNEIINVTGLEYFVNVNVLNLDYNNIVEFNLEGLPSLTYLTIRYNDLSSLDVSSFTTLEQLVIRNNNLTELNLWQNQNLLYLNVRNNPLIELDVSNNVNLTEITLLDLPEIEYINLKNGNNVNMTSVEPFYGMPNIQMVCVDNVETFFENLYDFDQQGEPWFLVATDCNFSPGQLNGISGSVNFELNNDCESENAMPVPNILVKTQSGENSFATLTKQDGSYMLYTDEGENITSAVNPWPDTFILSPGNITYNFSEFGNEEELDFCMASSGNVEDINVVILPMGQATPGNISTYKLIYENSSSITQSGEITIEFNESLQSFVGASVTENSSTSNSVTFWYSDLAAFQTEEISFTMQNEIPPILDSGDELLLTANITPTANDEHVEDNIFELNQTVVNSFDPNDKQVLEGAEIELEDADQYLHYIIRFQNLGTASAQNVVVKDVLDENLNWDSFRMVAASHDYLLEIKDGNQVEFDFQDIFLPAESMDEDGSKGFVAFKIKPKDDVQIGDFIFGEAEIYFDFNAAIVTNQVSTEIIEDLSVTSEEFSAQIQLYPNPVNEFLHIQNDSAKTIENVEVFSITGQLLFRRKNSAEINTSQLNTGVYFVKLTTQEGISVTKKVVKK
jgi:uncharacterized repeat protein (TIGR01451 family)